MCWHLLPLILFFLWVDGFKVKFVEFKMVFSLNCQVKNNLWYLNREIFVWVNTRSAWQKATWMQEALIGESGDEYDAGCSARVGSRAENWKIPIWPGAEELSIGWRPLAYSDNVDVQANICLKEVKRQTRTGTMKNWSSHLKRKMGGNIHMLQNGNLRDKAK